MATLVFSTKKMDRSDVQVLTSPEDAFYCRIVKHILGNKIDKRLERKGKSYNYIPSQEYEIMKSSVK